MKVDLGGATAVIESYPGHSGTDMIVRVPEQNVVYTGDLLFSNMYPVCFDTQPPCQAGGRPENIRFLDKDTLFVPGHGPIVSGRDCALAVPLRRHRRAGAEDAQSGVRRRRQRIFMLFPEKYKNVAIFAWDFSIGPTITKLYAEWGAK